MEKRIRVLIVDDHVLFSRGIKSLLQRHPEFEVVDDVADGLEGVKRAQTLRPDVVLLDLHMKGMPGRDAVRYISESVPETHVLMLTVSEDTEDLLDCLKGGASGYLVKNIETEALVDALHRVARGESVISPQMTTKLVQGFRAQAHSEPVSSAVEPERLSPREKEILGRLARGDTNKEIARSLELAESTVKIHIQNIFKKLHISSRVQAALYAVEHGYAVEKA